MAITTVLFDFDGVIADTENGVNVYLQETFSKYGITLTQEQLNSYIGTDGRKQTAKILKDNNKNVTVEEFFVERNKLGNYYENSPLLKPMENLPTFLDRLNQKGIKLGLVSSTNSKLIVTALNRMQLVHYFEVIVCGDMVKNKKPDPEPYLKAMEFLGVSPEDCVIVEDSPTGIEAGLKTGAVVVGFKGSEIPQDTSTAHIQWHSFQEATKQLDNGAPIAFI